MKHLASFLAAAILIAGVYVYQFGLPSIAGLPGQTAGVSQETARSGAANAQGQPARRAAAGGPGTGGPGPGGRGRAQGATYVTTAAVVMQPYADEYSAIGTGVAQKSVTLISEVSGQIRDVLFKGTPFVSKGDLLIQLDDTSERINVEIAKANLVKAQDSLERYQALQKVNSGVVPQVTIKEAEAALAIAKGNLALAEEAVKDLAIRAPIDGRLGLTEFETGDYLSSGSKIAEINNTDTILVNFELPERAISILKLGMPVRAITLSKPGQVFGGEITAFDSVIDEATRTITVRAEIDNPEGLLWPGMTFTIHLEEVSEPVASIPAMAMTWTREGTRVWVEDGGRVQPVPVVFRKRIDDTIWVEGDLKPGTKVVVDGVHKLRPGLQVLVAGPASGDNTASLETWQGDQAAGGQVARARLAQVVPPDGTVQETAGPKDADTVR
ncbi:efflux RND transporter periplasmic adaptor subunit [Labrenzia sp. 011]|uniref:efflux RND transporter periplasmic adaptor subunit n=1 Tax=Labrenzia sp. 011 TaxID=2171494 RepID=UPI000D511B51|nr:efflux RND transporter periplasmic adaptor subunit [Labrenzia sp. 011]PVB62383.1 efflux RND transporter periplasmic adaptor subunit [Labrenzia sp. 011]